MIAGRYTLDREIGRGGMGAVWLGQDEVLGREVALKRIGMMPGGSEPDLERAEREARLAARLNHPHVVAVFDLVLEDDQQWLVMEYVEGVTLSELVKRDGALSPDEASPLVAQAADALAAAHAAGIVHRDVKPSNILVTPRGQVKLSDFGIARAEADASLTQTGLVTGSPAYLAPEVASGQSATDASDVWSLGATLFHALAGHPPYEVGDNLMGALYRIVHEEPPRLDGAAWLAPLLEATMTRDPADRWTMAEVQRFLAAGPSGTVLHPEPTTTVAAGSAAGDAAGTQVLPVAVPPVRAATSAPVEPTVPRAPRPEPTVAATAAASPAPAPAPAPTTVAPAPAPTGTGRRRPGAATIVVVVALVVFALLVAFALLTGGNGGNDPSDDVAPEPTSSGSGSGSPSESTSAEPAGPTRAGMQEFITNYLATAPTDRRTAFEMLTPSFQAASRGYAGYDGFWSTIASASVGTVQANPKTLTVSYGVTYTKTDGSTTEDQVSLQLTYDADTGTYLIDGEG
ncbi:serine/threonine protein kinase [Nocardioides sp. KIGAM211]|uniref:non-specific serine/threonine protein kinase n=1 Tax=Nocardioides luti TaxID=2761101 RepID=A0A7X0VDK2_9ACTN|nr:serine/threonine protein kinase [Nocardioides luti]